MADEATTLLNQWRIDGQDAHAARLAPPKEEEGTMARIAREVSEGQAAQEKGVKQAEGIERVGQIDWGATAALPPRLKGVAIQQFSLIETGKSAPFVKLSTSADKLYVGSRLPTGDKVTRIRKMADARGIKQLVVEVTSPEGQRYLIREGPRQAQSQPGEIKTWDDYIQRMAQRRTATIEPINAGRSWTQGPGVMIRDPDHDDGTDAWLQGRLDDYANYQKEHIYENVPEEDILKASTADLNLRVGQPEKYGTIESSEQANLFGSGWTLHTVKGEDKTRHFFEKPETAETYNITGHPDAPGE